MTIETSCFRRSLSYTHLLALTQGHFELHQLNTVTLKMELFVVHFTFFILEVNVFVCHNTLPGPQTSKDQTSGILVRD